MALLALARRIFPAPGDAELRASALEAARAAQGGVPASAGGPPAPDSPAPEPPADDPAPPAGDSGARSPTITSDRTPPPDGTAASGEPAPFVAAVMDGEVAAEVVDAVKIYGYGETAVYALAGVSVSFGKAHFTAIMGPSGSGKSTLMHCLAGLDRLTQGTVLIGDTDLSTLSDKSLTQLRRDRVTFAMIVGVPIIQLTLFGFAINTNPKHLPTAVIVGDESPFSRSFVAAMKNSDYFDIVETLPDEQAGRRALAQGRVQFVLTVPVDFSQHLLRGEHPSLLVEADATDPTATGSALAALPERSHRASVH